MDDADALYGVLSDAEVMTYIEPPFDIAKTRAFIQAAGLCQPPLVYALVWQGTGAVIGQAIFHPYEHCDYEIGWIIHRDYWGRGIAGEVTQALVKRARELGVKSCVIECDARQAASKRIALKNGFAHEGRADALDVYRLTL